MMMRRTGWLLAAAVALAGPGCHKDQKRELSAEPKAEAAPAQTETQAQPAVGDQVQPVSGRDTSTQGPVGPAEPIESAAARGRDAGVRDGGGGPIRQGGAMTPSGGGLGTTTVDNGATGQGTTQLAPGTVVVPGAVAAPGTTGATGTTGTPGVTGTTGVTGTPGTPGVTGTTMAPGSSVTGVPGQPTAPETTLPRPGTIPSVPGTIPPPQPLGTPPAPGATTPAAPGTTTPPAPGATAPPAAPSGGTPR
jgi:hypothetical protein